MKRSDLLLIGFSGIVILVLVLSVYTFQGISAGHRESCCNSPMVCRGYHFVYITRNFSSPVTDQEIDNLKGMIDRDYQKTGGAVSVHAGGSGDGGFSSAGDSGNATVVSFGYYIDTSGASHEWRGVTANPEGAGVALAVGESWYNEAIRENDLEYSVRCGGY